jgi:zinc transport system substrate-binding protein
MRTILILAALAAAALLTASCGSSAGDEQRAGGGLRVVAGFYPLAWAAEQIAGARADVANLTPAGAEPHDLELSARQVAQVRDADVVLTLRGFQPALDDAAGARATDLLDGLDVLADGDEHAGEDEHRGADPHVWLDPLRFAAIARRLGDVLGDGAAGRRLAARLERLDRELAAGLERCERRTIVTSHAAFGYLAERYDLEQIAVAGVAPEAEPSPRALERLVHEVRRSGATTVFVEPLVSRRVAEAVARETGARIAVLNPIEGLTPADEERGADYVSLMRENLAALREALGCR